MRIVAIRVARFGDIVLLLPALSLLKARLPGCHLTFLTDSRWTPLAAMCPAIDEVLPVNRIGMRDASYVAALSEILQLLKDLRRRRFDVAIDFHGFRETNLLAWWSGAARRFGLKRADQSSLSLCFNRPLVIEDKQLHVSKMFERIVEAVVPEPAVTPSGPTLVIPEDASRWAQAFTPSAPYAVLYIDAPVKERVWPIDRFVQLSNHLTRSLGLRVVFLTGGKDLSLSIGQTWFSNPTTPQLAAVIARARILISNDTGPMHLGPILGTPTVGIFSVGLPEHFRPTGMSDTYVQANPIDLVQLNDVIEATERTLAASARLHPRY